MADIKPYKINVPDHKIQRLKQKLKLVDFPAEIEDEEPWIRGVPLPDMKRIVDYWANEYDWRKTEATLNKIPQFTTNITVDGFGTYNVHFVHQTSSCKNAIPLLFLHGWPGNFTEVQKILPLLVQGGQDYPAFHVVAPSLIDYGFSDRSRKQGFTSTQHGHAYHSLMQKLGYTKYIIQGGDLGSFIARRMVLTKPYQSHIGAHLLNLATPREPTPERDPALHARIQSTRLTDEEEAGLKRYPWFRKHGSGYNKLQRTKPQTIGYSMADSPVGLLAWIYEKLHDWTDSYPWTDDEILQWISIYYFSTAGPNATQHIYHEDAFTPPNPTTNPNPQSYSPIPLGISRFPSELQLSPKLWHETLGPLVFWSEHSSGGHFAAWERPGDLVGDLRAMFGRGGGAEGCCGKGKGGFDIEEEGGEGSGGGKAGKSKL